MSESIILIGSMVMVIAGTYAVQWAFKEVEKAVKKNYSCEHFEIISDSEETTYMGLTNPAMCDVKILNCTQRDAAMRSGGSLLE